MRLSSAFQIDSVHGAWGKGRIDLLVRHHTGPATGDTISGGYCTFAA